MAIVTGLLSGTGKIITHRLNLKAKKHNDILILIKSKLNTISNHISKALEDGNISDIEFNLVTEEVRKYCVIKEQIRSKATKTGEMDEKLKKELIDKGRQEERKSFLKKLEGGGVSH